MSMFVGEALTGEGNEIAHIDLLIGDKDGPVGRAFANALSKGITPICSPPAPITRTCADSISRLRLTSLDLTIIHPFASTRPLRLDPIVPLI